MREVGEEGGKVGSPEEILEGSPERSEEAMLSSFCESCSMLK
jgi:hypothetical protein